jgi:hypothetical protein
MDEEDYERLETIAAQEGVSVEDLIQTAVRERYLVSSQWRQALVDEICRLEIPLDDWDKIEEEISTAHDSHLP